jgi:hypothetical protein
MNIEQSIRYESLTNNIETSPSIELEALRLEQLLDAALSVMTEEQVETFFALHPVRVIEAETQGWADNQEDPDKAELA